MDTKEGPDLKLKKFYYKNKKFNKFNNKRKPSFYTDSKVAFLSSFPPRECGIATFTQDICSAMDKKYNPKMKSRVIAIQERENFYDYNDKVIMQLEKEDIEEYINLARKIDQSKKIKLVCIQHEFGLFGGEYGNYLVPFLEVIQKPVVINFHTVLPNPDEARRKVVRYICNKCKAVIVTSTIAIDILDKDYGVEKEKIHVIRHGIPPVPFTPCEEMKKKFGFEGKTVLATFGLLSKGKGQEYVIRALPPLVKKYPNLVYLIIGQTHPDVLKREGEAYREQLIQEVSELGLENNVRFVNKYMELQELIDYIIASDVYICTNLERAQISSGTLSYAMGCGKAIVSTPIAYAEDVLGIDRGIIVELKDPDSYTEAIDKILSDPDLKEKLEKNAYAFSRSMTWPNVATQYLSIFNKVVRLREEITEKFPEIKLNHLKKMTDDFGIVQFAKHSTPNFSSGYTVDNNSKALIATILHNSLSESSESLELARTYLNFLEKAQNSSKKFNDITAEKEVFEESSEDAFGRTIWALGHAIDRSNDIEIIFKSKRIFDQSINLLDEIEFSRAKSFCIIGLYHYYQKYHEDEIIEKIRKLADSLVELYETNSSKDWNWFEDNLSYANSKIPEALFFAYKITKNPKYKEVAEKTFNFLLKMTFVNENFIPVGQKGWYNKEGERAFFDQQPVDASSTVQTCLIAYKITGDKKYYRNAVIAFNWFLGRNHLKQMIYDDVTGGCYDSLTQHAVNLNQGAEATIAYLMARLFFEEIKEENIH
jgi:glycosyltransferase involved in cell wall biosynthesis